MLIVKPTIIDPNGVAEISHDGTSTVTVTITNQNGAQETISVPANTTVEWSPPSGWTEARFNTDVFDEVFRFIRETGASADA